MHLNFIVDLRQVFFTVSYFYLFSLVPELAPTTFMVTQPPPTPQVLILGHSFIRRLKAFIANHPTELDLAFQISAQAAISWRRFGGRTVAQAIQYDMKLVRSQSPDIVVVQLGTNDLLVIRLLKLVPQLKTLFTCCMTLMGKMRLCMPNYPSPLS